MIDAYRDLKAYQRAKRLIWGVPCPVCREKLPRANAKILEPGRICRAHKPSYRDPRPAPTEEEFAARMAAHGWGAQLGRAAGRERVWRGVEFGVVRGAIKKKTITTMA